jgi:hypothetical protein
MLHFIAMLGGLLLMMGQHSRSEALKREASRDHSCSSCCSAFMNASMAGETHFS